MYRVFTRSVFVCALLCSFVFLAGARCVENTSRQVDSSGYTHVYGEMYNETDIHGRQMVLRARLLAGDGSVIAEHDARLCPPDLAPHSQTMFDIKFEPAHLPDAANYDVRAIAGVASDSTLPDPKIALLKATASRNGAEQILRVDIKNNSGIEYFNLNACLAGYDAAGKVIAARTFPLVNKTESGTPTPGTGLGPNPDYALLRLQNAPAAVVSLRGWIWIAENSTNTSQAYQPVVTNLVSAAQ